ncbi:MAG: hypothetical protein IPK50_19105 [Fibrobacterota bacterium]|nr:hypothetical protein [Fibrobacterota bacterium]QQS04375.1 MAG: hypothetical protein IPK50_19105 [Fibrobacterota bacterium]
MNDLGWALALQVVAFALLFAEIFLPSGGILAVATVAVTALSLWSGFQHSQVAGWCILAADLVAFPICLKWGFGRLSKSGWVLQTRISGAFEDAEEIPSRGSKGTVVSDLRPVGKIRIGQREFDARSAAGFLTAGQSVEVCGAEFGQLLVKPVGHDAH